MVLTIEDDKVTAARGDRDDVFSHGYICPKGASLAELDNDPDRLHKPLVRRDGELVETSWDEAFAAAAEGLGRVVAATGGGSVGIYLGNPNAHTIAGAFYVPTVVPVPGHPQYLLRQHPRPDAQACGVRVHVRRSGAVHYS